MNGPGRAADRRKFLSAGAGVAAIAGLGTTAAAAVMTPSELANVQVVNSFCAACSS